ncbi:hypothetical protein [Rhizobium sp. P44RR-XXIV]|uniref:hypothetical protein n=1 Tax=Rhizobium sp. P44RR-XXIV TaxID=1921145 RepID=UPI0010AA0EF3|nr:hypothetical protein [Rhizobium sp. P44RR-XXIV]TIX90515.1 hypothetical protein BSK43_014690 [Rhizobium sp. P44RR-XXIV]
MFILYLPMFAYAAAGLFILFHARRWGLRKSSAILLAFLVGPWLFWGGSIAAANFRRSKVSDFLAGIQTTQVGESVPDTILIESSNTTLKGLPVGGCVKRVLANMRILGAFGHYEGPPIVEIDPKTGKLLGAAELPTRYLRFSNNNWVTPQVPNMPPYRHGPWELEEIDGTDRKVIAYYYEEIVTKPAFPPILSLVGWLHERSTTDFKKWTETDFVENALGHCAAANDSSGVKIALGAISGTTPQGDWYD